MESMPEATARFFLNFNELKGFRGLITPNGIKNMEHKPPTFDFSHLDPHFAFLRFRILHSYNISLNLFRLD